MSNKSVKFAAGALLSLSVLLGSACSKPAADTVLTDIEQDIIKKNFKVAVINLKALLSDEPANSRARWLLGQIHLRYHRGEDAVKELTHAAKDMDSDIVNPDLAEAYLLSGELEKLEQLPSSNSVPAQKARLLAAKSLGALQSNNLDKATLYANEATATFPESPYALYAGARLSRSRGNTADAYSNLETLLKIDSSFYRAWEFKAEIESARGEFDASLASYTRAIEQSLQPQSPLSKKALLQINRGNKQAAGDTLAQLRKLAPKAPMTYYVSGMLNTLNQSWEQAEEELLNAMDGLNASFPVLYHLGYVQYMQNHFPQARETLEKYFAINPAHIQGRKLLAAVYIQEQEPLKAEELLVPVILNNSDDIGATKTLAIIYANTGRVSEALELFEAIQEQNKQSQDSAETQIASLLIHQELTNADGQSQPHIKSLLSSSIEKSPDISQPYVLLALYLTRQGAYDSARDVARDFATRFPDSADPENIYGLISLTEGQTTAAKAAFEKALNKDPENTYAIFRLAEIAESRNQHKQAKTLYERALNGTRNDIPVSLKLADMDASQGNWSSFVKRLEETVKNFPEDIPARLKLADFYAKQARFQQAADLLQPAWKRTRTHEQLSTAYADALLQLGRPSEASKVIADYTDKRPPSPMLLRLQGNILERAQEYDSALESYRNALSAGKDPATEYAYTRLLFRSGKQKEGSEFLRKLEARNDIPFNLITALQIEEKRITGDKEGALLLIDALHKKNQSQATLLLLAEQYRKLDRLKESVAVMTGWLTDNPRDTTVRLQLSATHSLDNNLNAAIQQLREVLKLEPRNAQVLNSLAWKLRTQAPDEALKYAETGLNIAPNDSGLLDTMGYLLLNKGRLGQAELHFRRALDMAPNDSSSLYHYASLLNRQGNSSEAEKLLASISDWDFEESTEARNLLNTIKKTSENTGQ